MIAVAAAVVLGVPVISGGVAYLIHRSRLMLGYINRESGDV